MLELRRKMRAMAGKTRMLVGPDLGAPEDIPASCRVTGNPLLAIEPEQWRHWIKSKTDWVSRASGPQCISAGAIGLAMKALRWLVVPPLPERGTVHAGLN